MNLGQTSVVYFLSRLAASALGFVATVYFARLLGADALGIYYQVVALVSWLAILGQVGLSGAVSKRVSEGTERKRYAAAAAVSIGGLFAVLAVALALARPYVDAYVGYPATGYVAAVLFATLAWSTVASLLSGLHRVGTQGALQTVKTGGRGLLQIGALFAGFELAGVFFGYVGGFLVATAVGAAVVARELSGIARPRRRHFRSLLEYAKFAWLGRLQSRLFNYTDVLVLGLFVPSSLVGIYAAAWGIAQFLILFAGAISSTLFPEMSRLSADESPEAVRSLTEDALAYAGLLLIPGLVGGVIVGDRLLAIYGEAFRQGATVLAVLIVANLFMSYQNQLLNTLNAIDRPDRAFRVNALFVVSNVSSNVVLIYLYGWLGAAVATALSVAVSLAAAHRSLGAIVDVAIPYREIGRQCLAALAMGGVVLAGRRVENAYRLLEHNLATVFVLVGLGAGVYFLALLAISPRFRETVDRNLPVALPFLST
ncbi:probable flippase AglR [Natronomonas moolapensis 8.8.11]|uniref:Probable flippase AglR n=1 Tax=Natronomonas moolapensis (strain DSM 18674 / CECT 7526 / JCM 14361 / 8.8.11) TaxID=268739 RepID=M1XTC9_NATM8|nr:probable flippase AglR [Natronomonas moolapensis 8.8.11]